jgi:hypothetical protein
MKDSIVLAMVKAGCSSAKPVNIGALCLANTKKTIGKSHKIQRQRRRPTMLSHDNTRTTRPFIDVATAAAVDTAATIRRIVYVAAASSRAYVAASVVLLVPHN